jgi:hypothetical protein
MFLRTALSNLAILACLALLALAGCAAPRGEPGYAHGYGGGVVIDPVPLPFDPALLPPNTAPGDCVARTARGWVRVACGYRVAGRDADGYLVWPGKTP